MMAARRALPTIAAVALSAGAVSAQSGQSENEIVVSAFPNNDIVVNGRAIRCRTAPGDPLDAVPVSGWPDYMMIVPDEQGGFVGTRVTERITGPEFWQRVGIGMGAYNFRAPKVGKPMCIGGRGGGDSFGGFRRIVDAAPYRGYRLRFTAWVATRSAGQVSFWLAAGSDQLPAGDEHPNEARPPKRDRLLNGGNTNNVPFRGNHGWTPVLIETGPIHTNADHISYGFNLQGSGDVWVHEPRLEIVVDQPENARTDDRIVIGRSQSRGE